MHMIAPYRRRRYPSSLGFPMASVMPSRVKDFTASSLMKTDISKTDEGYELTMELPGFSKDGIQAEFKDGYLIVSASMEEISKKDSEDTCSCTESEVAHTEANAETKDQERAETSTEQNSEGTSAQTWVRRERFFGSCQRSFYLGEDINEEAISASFENGLLKVNVPQLESQAEEEKKTVISIQG